MFSDELICFLNGFPPQVPVQIADQNDGGLSTQEDAGEKIFFDKRRLLSYLEFHHMKHPVTGELVNFIAETHKPILHYPEDIETRCESLLMHDCYYSPTETIIHVLAPDDDECQLDIRKMESGASIMLRSNDFLFMLIEGCDPEGYGYIRRVRFRPVVESLPEASETPEAPFFKAAGMVDDQTVVTAEMYSNFHHLKYFGATIDDIYALVFDTPMDSAIARMSPYQFGWKQYRVDNTQLRRLNQLVSSLERDETHYQYRFVGVKGHKLKVANKLSSGGLFSSRPAQNAQTWMYSTLRESGILTTADIEFTYQLDPDKFYSASREGAEEYKQNNGT